MEAESVTGVTLISPGRLRRWHRVSTFSAQLQVSMEADSATRVTQISPGRPRRWHRVSTFSV
eukprot:4957598-Karenia_brevis.AAC.1